MNPYLMDRVSLSTCWCSHRYSDGYAMLEEIAGLGFKRVELSHGIKLCLVEGIQKALQDQVVEVGSMHNFCPLPNGIQYAAPNIYQPSTRDSWEQALWLRYTRRTLDFASDWGVKDVILHAGSARFFFGSPERKLDRWIEHSKLSFTELAEDPIFHRRCQRAVKGVRKALHKIEQGVFENFESLVLEANAKGLFLCVENREGLEEFPLDAEHAAFLERFSKPSPFAYWHDVGHAQIKSTYGLLDLNSQLTRLAPYLRGFHIHDLSTSGKDHQALGTGLVDFDFLASFFRPQHQFVLELSPKLTRNEVQQSRDFLFNLLSAVPTAS